MMKCILLAASALALASCGGSSDTTTPNTPINIDENAPSVDNGAVPIVDKGAVAKGENKADALPAGGHAVIAAAPVDAKHSDAAPAPAPAAKPQDIKAKHADVGNKADDHVPKSKQ